MLGGEWDSEDGTRVGCVQGNALPAGPPRVPAQFPGMFGRIRSELLQAGRKPGLIRSREMTPSPPAADGEQEDAAGARPGGGGCAQVDA